MVTLREPDMSKRKPKTGDYVKMRLRHYLYDYHGWWLASRGGASIISPIYKYGATFEHKDLEGAEITFLDPPCRFCRRPREDHADEKCVFQSTYYAPLTLNEVLDARR